MRSLYRMIRDLIFYLRGRLNNTVETNFYALLIQVVGVVVVNPYFLSYFCLNK